MGQAITHRLVMLDRESVGREASPSVAVIDSQSVKTTEAGSPRGYDAGKKVLSRKRHAMIDTGGRPLVLQVYPASVRRRDGAVPLLKASCRSFSFVELAFEDAAYAAERVADATCIVIASVHKSADQIGFAVHVGRGWLNAASLGSTAHPPLASSKRGRQCSSSDAWLVAHEFRVALSIDAGQKITTDFPDSTSVRKGSQALSARSGRR